MKLPVISSSKVIKVLERNGFTVLRQKGSHIILYKRTGNKTFLVVVPQRKEIKKGTLMSIIKQSGYTKQEFLKLFK
ncbi:MAG: hypothetical protein MSIBF_05395 [Candidatus Altiarchaeales archaeon IMC4]|nr:MAG: hypothetical protein MSIBF_05395 [Candidatus Altiarchaeales archaeon IMC4]